MGWQAAKVKHEEAQGGAASAVTGPLQRALDYPKRLRQFLHEVRVEMRQVTWPTWPDVYSTTFVVIMTVGFFALFFFIVDSAVAQAIQRVFKFFQR